MFIIIGQRIDYKSDYNDIPFKEYHFPKRYINQIKKGDIFVYYQGDRFRRENRYYYGCGVIGNIRVSEDGGHYFATIEEGIRFPKTVPIYNPHGGYYESIGYKEIRKKQNPPWQSSVRKLSHSSFKAIILASSLDYRVIINLLNSPILDITQNDKSILKGVLGKVNELELEKLVENINDTEMEMFLDKLDGTGSNEVKQVFQKVRKASRKTINSLKELYNYSCQICGINHGKVYGVNVVEAHHIDYFSLTQNNQPSNIIILCPTHHRLIHAGKATFDRKRKAYIYENGYQENIITNMHL